MTSKTLQEKIMDAEQRASALLGDANEFAEAGKTAQAEKLYGRGQYWLDRFNKLSGNA